MSVSNTPAGRPWDNFRQGQTRKERHFDLARMTGKHRQITDISAVFMECSCQSTGVLPSRKPGGNLKRKNFKIK